MEYLYLEKNVIIYSFGKSQSEEIFKIMDLLPLLSAVERIKAITIPKATPKMTAKNVTVKVVPKPLVI